MDNEEKLAKETKSGNFRGSEWAWKPEECPFVLEKAKELGLACMGGQAQFRLPDATCEMYWVSIEPPQKEPNETWENFSRRSNTEVLNILSEQVKLVDFLKAAQEWPHVKEKTIDVGLDPKVFLVYVLYFESEKEYIE